MEAVMAQTTWRDWWELTKPRLNFLVLLSALSGYALAPSAQGVRTPFWAFAVAFWLLAASSAVLNMWMERDSDALMERTRNRPLASGRVNERTAFWLGQILALASMAILAAHGDWLSAALGLATWGSYLLVYTPLKRRSPLSLLAGAVTGALPPVMGWTAAGGSLDQGALALCALLFVWQIPHFLAIAELYADQYRQAGIKVLTLVNGREAAGRQMMVYAFACVPVSLWLRGLGLGGAWFTVAALILGAAFGAAAVRAALKPSRSSARTLLLASVTYLPLLLTALIADHP